MNNCRPNSGATAWSAPAAAAVCAFLWLNTGPGDLLHQLSYNAMLSASVSTVLFNANPLLRYEGFEPRAGGVRALLPHVDAFLPVHNLASLEDLATQLTTPARARATGRGARTWN